MSCYSNIRDLDRYIEESFHIEEREIEDTQTQELLEGISLHDEACKVKRDAQMEEFMFLGLRMTGGIEKGRFYQTFGFTVDNIYGNIVRMLVEAELLVDTPTKLYLTERGIDLSNYVLAQFLL